MNYHNCSKDQVKKLFTSLTFGGSYSKWLKDMNIESPFEYLNELNKEYSTMMDLIWEHNSHIVADILKDNPSKFDKYKNETEKLHAKKRTCISFFYQTMERAIQETMILYLSKQKNFKLEDIVPCQNGFMILKELFYDNILEECETAIINRYNFNVKLKVKDFDEKFIIPIYTPIINEEEQIEIEKEKEKSIVEHKNKINSLFDDNEDYLNVFPIEILMIGIDENEPNKEEAIEAHRINCKQSFEDIINEPSEVAFANFINLLFGNIAVCVNIKQKLWYFYENQLWNDDEKQSQRSLIDEKIHPIIVRHIIIVAKQRMNCNDEETDELLKKRFIRLREIANKLMKTSERNNICVELAVKCFKKNFCKDMNKAKNQLPLKNGLLLDMKTLQTRPRNINDKFSLECPINFIENLNKKDYEFADKYFNDLFCNNSKVVQSVLDIFKSLISGNLLRYVFFMTGEGRNGKSLVIKLLNQMFGSLMKVMDKSIIIENGVKSNLNTHLEKLETIRIGYISELKENDSLNGELIKGISGGDQQDVRGLYKSNTEIKPTANLICACNHLPKFNVEDKALIDRLVVIPFNNRFEINTSFENDLLEKIDIIFSYIMQKGVITDKFDFPDEMIEATKLYVKENDNDPLRD